MDRQAIVDAAIELIRAGRAFVFATVDAEGFPQLRWMGGSYVEEPLTVYMAAAADSRKIAQLSRHSEAQLLYQRDDHSRVAALMGSASVVSDQSVKRRVFAGIPGASEYFSGPEDSAFGVIKFVCSRIEVLGLTEGMTPAVADI